MSLLTLSNALSWVKLLIYFCALGRWGSKQGYKLPLEIWGLLLGGSLNVPVGTKCVTVTLRYTTENLMEFFSGLEISFEFSLCFLISILCTVQILQKKILREHTNILLNIQHHNLHKVYWFYNYFAVLEWSFLIIFIWTNLVITFLLSCAKEDTNSQDKFTP